jgi:hypothetical protein
LGFDCSRRHYCRNLKSREWSSDHQRQNLLWQPKKFRKSGFSVKTKPPKPSPLLPLFLRWALPEAREASNNWRQWSTRLEWFKRADAFDRYHAALDRQAEERAFAQERRKWASRRATIRDEAWNDAEALRARAREILRLPLSEEVTTDVIVEEGDDGKKTINRTVIVKPLRASMSDAGQMLKHADNLSRLAADMETERVLHDSLEAQKARQLEDARQAYRESKDLYPDETPLARAHALSIAYGFSVEAIMQEPPTLDGESHLS